MAGSFASKGLSGVSSGMVGASAAPAPSSPVKKATGKVVKVVKKGTSAARAGTKPASSTVSGLTGAANGTYPQGEDSDASQKGAIAVKGAGVSADANIAKKGSTGAKSGVGIRARLSKNKQNIRRNLRRFGFV